jgi:hypothetical protein
VKFASSLEEEKDVGRENPQNGFWEKERQEGSDESLFGRTERPQNTWR